MWRTGLLVVLAACGFHASDNGSDGGARDTPQDMTTTGARVEIGLLGAWAFDETSGNTVHDQAAQHVDLNANGSVIWGSGTMVVPFAIPAIVAQSPTAPGFSAECISNHGVTLEAWVSPAMMTQGAVAQPVVVAGLDSTVASRNISILQAGDRWLGRVRTNMTDVNWANGGPDLIPEVTKRVETKMTHIVVVADSSIRALYVNGHVLAQTSPEPPTSWDASHKMVLANEISLYRPWLGTFAMVALYNRALSDDEISQNYSAGPTAALMHQ